MTFQELVIRPNCNGHSGAEKAYKGAIRKLRKQLEGDAYGFWRAVQRTIQAARREAGGEIGYRLPQSTWLDKKDLTRSYGYPKLCANFLSSVEEKVQALIPQQYPLRGTSLAAG